MLAQAGRWVERVNPLAGKLGTGRHHRARQCPCLSNVIIWLAGLGCAAPLRIACVAGHMARSTPGFAAPSSGRMTKLFRLGL